MQNLGKRGWLFISIGLLAVPVTAAGVAYACTGLATVSSNPGAGVPGATVTLTGKGFVAHDPSDARTSPAAIRLDTLDGPVLATASPEGGPAGGSFSVKLTVPQVSPGEHVIVVTQPGTDGRPAYGTPARQVFTVLAPPAPPPVAAAPAIVNPFPVVAVPPPPAASAPTVARRARAGLAKALAKCNRQYSSRKAKTRIGKARMAKRRAACRRSATRRYAS